MAHVVQPERLSVQWVQGKVLALVPLQVASVRSGGMHEQKCFTVYSKERLEEIIAQIKK